MTDTTDLADPLVDAPARAEAIAKEFEQFVYIVSHDMGAIKSMCQHVVLMDQGLAQLVGGFVQRFCVQQVGRQCHVRYGALRSAGHSCRGGAGGCA